jgi:cell wall-associated NlpC family hydrolase
MRKHLIIIFCFGILSTSCILFRPASEGTLVESEPISKSSPDSDIVEIARSLEGIPYKYGGTTKRGFDCSGFTSYVYAKNNASLPRTSAEQETYAKSVKIKDLQAGDLLFFRPNKVGKVFHVALVVDNSREGIIVIHSTSSRGVIEENISKSSYWTKKYWTGGRIYNE